METFKYFITHMSNMILNNNTSEILESFSKDYNKKIYGRDISKKLNVSVDVLQLWIDFLVEETEIVQNNLFSFLIHELIDIVNKQKLNQIIYFIFRKFY